MLLTLIILLLLANAIYSGARRGLVLQVLYTGGYLISYIVARLYYQRLAPKLELLIPYPSATENSNFVFFSKEMGLELDKAFYAATAFLLILFIGWLIIHFIGIFSYKLTFFPIVKQTNLVGGSILNFVVTYVAIFLLLYTFSMIPLDFVQNQFRSSGLARFIVEHTPIFSKQIQNWWVNLMI